MADSAPLMTHAPAVVAEGLVKTFITGTVPTRVLTHLDLSLHPGEMTLISGPSGCGKSTLLSLLSGLQKPDAGAVTALNQRLDRLSRGRLEAFRLQHTGFVFQGFNLFPALTAVEQVQLPLGYLGMDRRQSEALALKALDEVGLNHRLHMRPAQLSGGEKQRVAIARAIAKSPALLFADEPTSALDAENGQRVSEMLRQIAHRHGATVVCVSHDPRLIRFADRLLTMEDGVIQRDERPAQPSVPSVAPGSPSEAR